jgi:hypothetical protein
LKKLFFILLIVYDVAALAQTENPKKIKVEKEKSSPTKRASMTSVDVLYGQKVFGKTTPAQIKQIDTLKYNWPTKYIGIGFSALENQINPRNTVYWNMFTNLIYPQSLRIDSVNYDLQGFIYNVQMGIGPRARRKIFTIIVAAGFNTGVLRTKSDISGIQYNPFFAPCISLQPKLIIKRIAFSLIVNCDNDISNPAWKSFSAKEPEQFMQGLNQTSFSAMATLGYRLYF